MMKNSILKINEHLTLIKTKKYKDINMYLYYSLPYSLKQSASLTILSKMFGEASKKYPDKTSMAKARDLLYGLNVSTSCKPSSGLINFVVQYSFINPKFLKDVSIDDDLDYVSETLFKTLINKKLFLEAKRNVISTLLRKLDKPTTKAFDDVFTIIHNDHPSFGSNQSISLLIKGIRKLKVDDVIESYKYILKKAQLDVYLCGDINKTFVSKLSFIKFDKRINVNEVIDVYENDKFKSIIKKADVGQSVLHVVYETPYSRKHKDFFKFIVGNVFLGKVPTSLLFEEVREKLSLCYTIGVIDSKNNGFIDICTNIDGKNKDVVVKKIDEQIQRIINMDYDENKLYTSVALFENVVQSINDDQSSLVDYMYVNKMNGLNLSIEQYCKAVKKVKKEDIADIFKNYHKYFVYMLQGKQDEKKL